jgi:hypothetical protein
MSHEEMNVLWCEMVCEVRNEQMAIAGRFVLCFAASRRYELRLSALSKRFEFPVLPPCRKIFA